MRSLVEEHAHAVVGELVAEAVLVRVVDPLGHPQKGLGPRQTGRVPASCKKNGVKKSYLTAPRYYAAELSQSLIHDLPAGMLARQSLSTFTADSATAVGVATSSHAIEKSRRGGENAQQRVVGGGEIPEKRGIQETTKAFLRSVLLARVPLKEREIDFLDSSSAGVCSRGAELAS